MKYLGEETKVEVVTKSIRGAGKTAKLQMAQAVKIFAKELQIALSEQCDAIKNDEDMFAVSDSIEKFTDKFVTDIYVGGRLEVGENDSKCSDGFTQK